MNSMAWCIRASVTWFVISYSLLAIAKDRAVSVADANGVACAGALYHEFDFWIGDWDVFDLDSPTKVARTRIDSILGGCVLRENYQSADGFAGQSFTIYDTARGVWHQTWVTSGGTLLEIEGRFANGEMVLTGTNQKGEMVRGTWKQVDGGVRETAVKSTNVGKSWEPWFDIIFRPSQTNNAVADPTEDPDHEKEEIARLDSEYQQAVKRNDAATMGQILSGDFVLITSSGKMYTKRELLDEARSGRISYEHQEDTDKTVRLWGDTAVVTARLWEKGTENGKPFDYKLWFSDVYRRTPTGWRYVFAQSADHASGSIP